ncbi:hypothetical protein OSB04_006057 [Centaurea solstitialis]|uniref:Reverse transcriptase zinc-binding domain-containing protein n=1 Tax=Centaurea solstitialis TaxID=347529 RepID=A0AA38WHB6_9ASTR|nr:hypothetical protein OSB04_006057 [Centaurea solstitialis]
METMEVSLRIRGTIIKQVLVADKIKDGRCWSWRRTIRDGREANEFKQLTEVIGDASLTNNPDKWVWDLTSNGSLRSLVEKAFLGVGDKETSWNSKVPSKADIFMWRVMLDKLPTRDNLIKKGMDIDSTLCSVCKMDNESMQHVLFDCINVVEVWRFVEKWWSLSLPMNKSLD